MAKPEKDPDTGRFVTGNSGGGRKKGSRNKLGEEFLADLHADWQENGRDAIMRVREEKPDAYLKVIASILPKQIEVNPAGDLSDEQLEHRIRALASELGLAVEWLDGTGGAASGKPPKETAH